MSLITEVWKSVVGYEGLYSVSNFGRIKNSRTNHILKPQRLSKGYQGVTLYKNNKRKTQKVHRVVAIAFIPNPTNLPSINHKDEDKTNNHVDNLEWCDAKYNNTYGTFAQRISKALQGRPSPMKGRHHTEGAKRKLSLASRGRKFKIESLIKKSIPVAQCDKDTGKILKIFYGASEASRQTGIDSSSITAVCRGRRGSAGGYRWMYEKDRSK